jgi:hypothetical protein
MTRPINQTNRAGECACDPSWPTLIVRTDDGRTVTVEPADSQGGLESLYEARCGRCDVTYPGHFRPPPRNSNPSASGTNRACHATRSAPTRAPHWPTCPNSVPAHQPE